MRHSFEWLNSQPCLGEGFPRPLKLWHSLVSGINKQFLRRTRISKRLMDDAWGWSVDEPGITNEVCSFTNRIFYTAL